MVFRKLIMQGVKVEVKTLEEFAGLHRLFRLDDGMEYSISELCRKMFFVSQNFNPKSGYMQKSKLIQRLENFGVLIYTRTEGRGKYYRLDMDQLRSFLKNWLIGQGIYKENEEIHREW